jgi:hypothetical protein
MVWMPTFCRHNHLVQNCTICSRELNIQARPVVSSSAPKSTQPREAAAREGAPATKASSPRPRFGNGPARVKVRRLARGVEDGFRSKLVPGLKSSEDADRLAEEIAFAARRLEVMTLVAAGESREDVDPIWIEIAADGDMEARTMLALQTVLEGQRGCEDADREAETLAAYEAWAQRAGSQEAAFTGEAAWPAERRFERLFERLGGLPGMTRDIRFELLVLMGRLGLYDLRAGKLQLSGENEATWAAKRALGIGDPLLLDRRAAELAAACDVQLETLDVALHNWGSGTREGLGFSPDAEVDELVLARSRSAFGL